MKFPISMLKNELITAIVLSLITTVLVLLNVPRYRYLDENDEVYTVNRTWIAFKTLLISFVVVYALLYFFATDSRSSLISNMKQGEPEF